MFPKVEGRIARVAITRVERETIVGSVVWEPLRKTKASMEKGDLNYYVIYAAALVWIRVLII